MTKDKVSDRLLEGREEESPLPLSEKEKIEFEQRKLAFIKMMIELFQTLQHCQKIKKDEIIKAAYEMNPEVRKIWTENIQDEYTLALTTLNEALPAAEEFFLKYRRWLSHEEAELFVQLLSDLKKTRKHREEIVQSLQKLYQPR